ncbi:BZ3500_MvSof-1268-A1-R1_Chr11-1g03313 [Microbotryum saponariae]|uniref:Carboxylic ester hydrolase n=1 Tax=Microbotryum saponariae TaxID=289078 RepID=A0A2X0LFS2_9BASI|nr:BZ3501_MvSof-1269-A2-R1_Chr11g02889 [Microbotryum saponariae]SDA03940.1 BZ3500_MvSof-1268-A1-R1_Chr11-1g03313 [Microbotryum saponariae]
MVGFGTSPSFLTATAVAALCLTGVNALTRRQGRSARVADTDFSTRCANMASVKMPDMTIYATEHYGANSTFSPSGPSRSYNDPVPGLAAFCRFGAEIKTSSQSKVQFELWMPDDWSGRFAMVGNGGDAGSVNYPDMGVPLTKYKFAVASTDTGHSGWGNDGSFAISNPQSQIDFGHRAVHLTATYSKSLIRTYYGGGGANHSYWIGELLWIKDFGPPVSAADGPSNVITAPNRSGCSSGGRQGLKEIQLNADTFDGVLAGAAAQWWPHLNGQTYRINTFVNKIGSPGYLTAANYATIGTEVLNQCDVLGLDKLKDGIITDPTKCSPKLEGLLCSAEGANQTTCLSQAQIKTMYAIWADWKSSTGLATGPGGTNYFPGFQPGAEGYPGFSVTGTPYGPSTDYFNYQVLNKTSVQPFNVTEAELEKLLKIADDTDPGQTNAIDPDIGAFLKRNKLMTYVGLADNFIPAGTTLLYHDRVKAKLGNVDHSFRHFAVPGMLHCGGGNGAYHLGQASQRDISLGGSAQSASFTAKDDMILALIAWVEKNQAPDSLVGVNYVNGDKRQGVAFERLVCSWPKMGYHMAGDSNKASSFSCQ